MCMQPLACKCQTVTEFATRWTMRTCLSHLHLQDVVPTLHAACLLSACTQCAAKLSSLATLQVIKSRGGAMSAKDGPASAQHNGHVVSSTMRCARPSSTQARRCCASAWYCLRLFHCHHGCRIPPQPELLPGSRHPLAEDRTPQAACAEPTHLCLHETSAYELNEK